MGKDMDQPVTEVHPGSLAASQQGVEDGRILRRVVVPREKEIFPSLCWQYSYVGIVA